jgi:ankyrin repeat protein
MEGDINDDDDAILDEPAEEDENTMQHVLMLSKSLFKACEEGDLDRVKILLQSGANPNLHNEDDSEKRTPFLIAAEKGHYDIVKILLEYGADPELGTLEIGNNALHLASREGHHRVIELLLAPREEGGGGLNINSRSNIANWTALHQAASAGRVETVKFLVQRGADLEAKTSHGQTALSLAVENCKAQCVKTLLELGANPNKGDIFGQTPLFYAARIAALNVLKILVEEGNADVNILDSRGNTAFDEADKASMWECALYLWRHGAVVKSGKKGVKVGPLLWKRPRVVGTPPSARNNAACCCVGTKVYIFGGNGHKQGYVCSDPDASLHHLNIESVAHNDLYYFDVKHLETDLIIPINEKTKKNLRLNRKRMGKFLRLSEDELTVESTPESAIDDELVDSTSIQATDAYRADEDDFGYFEIFVIDSGTKGIVTFGLTDENFDLDALPGWNRHTYGYHGDDGAVFHNRGRGTPWGPRYTTGDTVGCGINFRTKEVFFTKNGEFLGVAFKECPENVLYPTIGIRNPRAKVRVNFGLQPFKFTFEVPILKVIPISSTEFCPPPQRFAHFLKLDENRLLMLGSNCMHLSTLYIFDIEKSVWSSKACIGQHPTFHYEDIPFLLNNKIYVYSGNPKNTDMSFKLTRPPELYSLDTTQPSWEWTMKVPASRKTSDDKQSDHPLDSEFRQRVEEVTYLLATYHRNSRVCVVGNEIVFVSSQKMLKLDPETMKYSESELEGKRPTAQYYSTTVVNKDIVTFGGWDEREQQFDVYILDTGTL